MACPGRDDFIRFAVDQCHGWTRNLLLRVRLPGEEPGVRDDRRRGGRPEQAGMRGEDRALAEAGENGSAVFVHEAEPCQLRYRVSCDSSWRMRSAEVEGWVGDRDITVSLSVDDAEVWSLNGEVCAAVQGCIDVDLNFSPSTNLLPIRRLQLAIGDAAAVRAAWLRFPSFRLEPLEQVYRRTAVDRYRYESAGGAFVADLEVDTEGLVTDYPPIWQAEPVTGRRVGSSRG